MAVGASRRHTRTAAGISKPAWKDARNALKAFAARTVNQPFPVADSNQFANRGPATKALHCALRDAVGWADQLWTAGGRYAADLRKVFTPCLAHYAIPGSL